MSEQEHVKFVAVKSSDCYYITIPGKSQELDWASYDSPNLSKYFFDGETLVQTTTPGWYKLPKYPTRIYTEQRATQINFRYELVEKSLANETIKLVLDMEEVSETRFYGDERSWKKEFAHLESLYTLAYDTVPGREVDISFEIDVLFVEEVQSGVLSYNIEQAFYNHELQDRRLTESAVQHQLADKLFFPKILLPAKPSKLTSRQSFDIVRQYIKEHMDREVAVITSDYDFCFTVEKRIALDEAVVDRKEILTKKGTSYKRPRYATNLQTFRSIEVFEMTWSPKCYTNYSVLAGFRGESHADLKQNIDKYCSNLIQKINEPLQDCPHCHGRGVLVVQKTS